MFLTVTEDTWFDFDTFLDDLGDCDPDASYDTDSRDLFGAVPGFGTGSATADCPTSKKRSANKLRLKMRLSLRIPRTCTSITCRRAELRKLYIRAVYLQRVVQRGATKVTVTNRATAKQVEVPVTGTLNVRAGRLSMSCDTGSVLVGQICGMSTMSCVWYVFFIISFA